MLYRATHFVARTNTTQGTQGSGSAGPAGAPPQGAGEAGRGVTSKLVVISAVLPIMIEAEQYFSCDIWMARATAVSGRFTPVTMKCMLILVNTLGSVSARSAWILTWQPRTSWRPRLRISTTS